MSGDKRTTFSALCNCGWVGPTRTTAIKAGEDADDHAPHTPQWLRDVLTQLSAVAHDHHISAQDTKRVLLAVPRTHLADAGLAGDGSPPHQTLSDALGHDDPDGTCDICVNLRDEMEAIRENERQAAIRTQGLIIGEAGA